jgi:hypothetical protein
MATPIVDIRPVLQREINVPGFEQLPDITGTELDGYIKNGFWECRLLGMLDTYTQTDGTEFATPPGDVIKLIADDGDLPDEFQLLVAIMAALTMLRLKIMALAINFTAEAGPVSYEQQASATVLRAILATLEKRVAELADLYSDEYNSVFTYFDSTLQRESSYLQGALQLQVI